MKTTDITFGYNIVNFAENKVLDHRTTSHHFTTSEVEQLAQIMQENGGYRMELCDLGNFFDTLSDDFFADLEDVISDYDFESGDINIDDYEAPDEFWQMLEEHVPTLTADLCYHYHVGDKEECIHLDYPLPRATFNKMKAILLSPVEGKSPFAILAEADAAAYEQILSATQQEAIAQMKEGHVEALPYLDEFPWQVYEHLND